MLAQSFHFTEILIVAYLHLYFGSASSVGSNTVDHTADSSYYLCAGTSFSNRAVEINRQLACERLHNADPISNFPAKLEDNRLFDGAPDALIVWPIMNEETTYRTRVPGKMRIVIDLDCNLAGLIIRYENAVQRCIKLSSNAEVDSTGPDLDTYKGYNCSNTFFSSAYVEETIAKAVNTFERRLPTIYRNKFPKLGYCRSTKQRTFSWPLLVDHTPYNSGETAKNSRIYFVEFSVNMSIKRVLRRSHDIETCPIIRTVILPDANAKSLAHTHRENEGRRQMAVCLGQSFSSSYLRLNKEKAIRDYAQFYANKHKNYRYPRHSSQFNRKMTSSEWFWPLRHMEKALKRNNLNVSYILVLTGRDKFKGVFYRHDGKLKECKLEDEVEDQRKVGVEGCERDGNISGLDLNKPLGCWECWKSEGCLCPHKNQDEMTEDCISPVE
ncbi:BgtE-6031 [Blumeria graminis f. sp. tritici]|uniref:BgtE-6031 n=2 Tax=Blumeria graminis f. sp. tritici TaxID=62690 RepID=A0A9X9QF73_BLUGR|nr:BgtE-6031 [Blumeria graminis f. sp. tritici]